MAHGFRWYDRVQGVIMAKVQNSPGALQALKNEIKQEALGRLYIFHGEEQFLLHHYLEQMRKVLIDELTESFNFHKLTAETFDIRSFADCVECLPMMAEHTMVIVDDIDLFKQNEADREKIVDIISDIPEHCTVVFTYETVAWKPDKRLKKLWEALQQNGHIIEFAKQEQRDLIAWITRHFHANKKHITPDLCAYLIELTGGTMTMLSSEISKICAYSAAENIVKSDIDAVTEPVLDAVVFQMTDLLSQGAYGPALLKLRQLFQMQQEPLAILGAIGKHIRCLGAARILMDNGKNANELMRICGLADYAARKTMNSANKFSASFCSKAAEYVLETDNAIKTSYDDPERLLEVLVLRLAQEAKNG